MMMDDKMLISLVKEHPVLYNSHHKHYMDVSMKVDAWKEIGAQMNTDGERCKQRWNNIRDNYKKFLKKLVKHKSMKPYRFAWHLNFLKKYMEERDPSLPTSDFKFSEDEECETQSQPEANEEETSHEDNGGISAPGCEVVISVPSPQPGAARKRKEVRETASSVLMKYLLEKKSAVGMSTEGQPTVNLEHPVDAFLFSLAPTLKALPQHLLTSAKADIFACVQKYEMKRHNPKRNSLTAKKKMNIDMPLDDEEERSIEELGTASEKTPYEVSQITPSSSITQFESPSKRQKLSDTEESQNDLLKLARELLSSCCKQPEEANDEYASIAKLWTCKLKALVPTQKRLAERAINEVLFEAESGTLHRNSLQINYFSEPNSVSAPHPPNLSAVGSSSIMSSQAPTFASQSSTTFNNVVSFSKTDLEDSFQ